MKKQFLIALIWALVFPIIFISCKKDHDPQNHQTNSDETLITNNDNIANLLAFRDRISLGNLKSGETIEIEDAIDYIEGVLNLTYGSASYAFEKAHRTSFDIEIELNTEGSIDMDEAIDKYGEALDDIKAFYGSISASQKQLIGVDVNLKETLSQKIVVTFKPVVGTPPINIMNFGTTDWWEWGFGNGKCGGYEDPIYIGRDAAGEIKKKILARKGVPAAGYVYLEFWSDFDPYSADQYFNDDDITPGDNIRDYLMYGNWPNLPNFNTCISNSDMNFYLTGTEDVINQNKPTGMVLFDVIVTGDMTITTPAFYHHWVRPTYATLYYSGENPKGLD